MKRLNVSTKQMGKFAGKWVAIDYEHERIVAVGDTLKEIESVVSGRTNEKKKLAAAFKVPFKDEGPYIL